jgi:hypothetical protein
VVAATGEAARGLCCGKSPAAAGALGMLPWRDAAGTVAAGTVAATFPTGAGVIVTKSWVTYT